MLGRLLERTEGILGEVKRLQGLPGEVARWKLVSVVTAAALIFREFGPESWKLLLGYITKLLPGVLP